MKKYKIYVCNTLETRCLAFNVNNEQSLSKKIDTYTNPPNDTVCSSYLSEFTSPALQSRKCNIYYHPTCAGMPLYYMVRNARSTLTFECKECTKKWAEFHLTDTEHHFQGLLH